jgi:GDP/UDP-N,N'-diacetylbacillosamine 2-epimerase (hydrolysing)
MRKICIITGTRAEYGLLRPLMELIQDDPALNLQIIATCMHLSPEFGLTYREIEADGFKIDKKIEMLLSSDTPVGITKSMGLAFLGFADAFAELQPDIVVLLGDRFETFCAAGAACVARLPIAHIHGGEVTEGAIDDAFRHAITKMSHLHFTSTEEYRRRVIQLGEHPDRVFNVGAIGVETIMKLPLLGKEELQKKIGFNLGDRYFLVTFHPVTLESSTAEDQFKSLLNALDQVTSDPNQSTKIIFTKANADTDGRVINHLIDEYVAEHSENAIAFTSMGQLRYLSAMKYGTAVVGNSSSGIVEAPSFGIPTVNIGDRQKGRIKAKSVIDCDTGVKDIIVALRISLSHEFTNMVKTIHNPYEKANTAMNIKDILRQAKLSGILKKQFFDMDLPI